MLGESVWPRGGWARAAQYVKHRLRRLPDRPDRVARGIFAGVFVSFTPFYGLHFIAAAMLAKVMRGNILAALLSTFFGNPITFPIIAAVSLKLGNWMLGGKFAGEHPETLFRKFSDAAGDLWHNLGALFTNDVAQWQGLHRFYLEVFLPYLIGGIIPGIIVSTVMFYVSLPLITAYQNRRKLALKRKFESLRATARKKTPDPQR